MSDENKPSESEQKVHDLVGDTGGDQPEHEAVPFEIQASNPSSSGEPGLSGDLGISSERTTPDRPRSDGVNEVDFEPFDAPDVSTAPREPGESDTDRADADLRESGEPRPSPITDEKNRRQ